MYPRIKLAVPLYRPAGISGGGGSAVVPEAVSLLEKLISWYDFNDNLNDSAGPYPVNQSTGSISYGNPPTLSGSELGRALVQGAYAETRRSFPNLAAQAHGVATFCYTSSFAIAFNGDVAGLGGASQFINFIRKYASVPGWLSRTEDSASNLLSVTPAAPALATNTTAFIASEFAPGSKNIYVHQNGTYRKATGTTSTAQLRSTNRFNVGEASGGYPSESSIAVAFVYRGALTEDEVTYLYNSGKGRNYAGIVADAGYSAPAFNMSQTYASFGLGEMATSYSKTWVAVNGVHGTTNAQGSNTTIPSGRKVFGCRITQAMTSTSTYIGVRTDPNTSGGYGYLNLTNTNTTRLIQGNFSYGTDPALTTVVAGDVLMWATDSTARKVWVGKNGTFSGDPAAGTGEAFTFSTAQDLYVWVQSNDITFGAEYLFTSSDYPYVLPSGFTPCGS